MLRILESGGNREEETIAKEDEENEDHMEAYRLYII